MNLIRDCFLGMGVIGGLVIIDCLLFEFAPECLIVCRHGFGTNISRHFWEGLSQSILRVLFALVIYTAVRDEISTH